MDNQQRLWGRLLSRLRWSQRADYSCAQVSRTNPNTSRTKFWQLIRSRSAPVRTITPPPLEVNVISEPGNNVNWPSEHSVHLAFNRRLAEQQEGFTPKCLSGLNTQTLLNGQGSVENFSRNCWLENNLHRFGQFPSSVSTDLDSEDEIDTVNNVPTRSQLRMRTFQRVLRANQLINSLLRNSSVDQPVQTASTIFGNSSISNMNLSGFAFNPEAMIDEPPPYSELPEDPPPSYAESTRIEYQRHAADIQIGHSELLTNADYLY
uniref:Uncharacterized protein n=1 Tax=Biomphalaria glabrata TaxID=6526 RepID=A0A2C9M048_BIOGL